MIDEKTMMIELVSFAIYRALDLNIINHKKGSWCGSNIPNKLKIVFKNDCVKISDICEISYPSRINNRALKLFRTETLMNLRLKYDIFNIPHILFKNRVTVTFPYSSHYLGQAISEYTASLIVQLKKYSNKKKISVRYSSYFGMLFIGDGIIAIPYKYLPNSSTEDLLVSINDHLKCMDVHTGLLKSNTEIYRICNIPRPRDSKTLLVL